jgi:hypothetical protein
MRKWELLKYNPSLYISLEAINIHQRCPPRRTHDQLPLSIRDKNLTSAINSSEYLPGNTPIFSKHLNQIIFRHSLLSARSITRLHNALLNKPDTIASPIL